MEKFYNQHLVTTLETLAKCIFVYSKGENAMQVAEIKYGEEGLPDLETATKMAEAICEIF